MAETKTKAPSGEVTQLVEIEHEGIEKHGFVTPISFKKLWSQKGWKLSDAKAAEPLLEKADDVEPIALTTDVNPGVTPKKEK